MCFYATSIPHSRPSFQRPHLSQLVASWGPVYIFCCCQRLKDEFFLPPPLEHRYRLEEVIGEGSYGVVCSAVNLKTGERVAIKRIMRVFEEFPEAMRTLRELKFFRLLKDHENIISIRTFSLLPIVTTLMTYLLSLS